MDISNLDKKKEPDSWHTVTFAGSKYRLGYTGSDPLEVRGVERKANAFDLAVAEQQRKLNELRREYGVDDLEDDEVPADRLEGEKLDDYRIEVREIDGPDPDQMAPKIDFILDHLVACRPANDDVEPLDYEGETDWSAWPESGQRAVVRRLGLGQIWSLYDAIARDDGLEPDEKKP